MSKARKERHELAGRVTSVRLSDVERAALAQLAGGRAKQASEVIRRLIRQAVQQQQGNAA